MDRILEQEIMNNEQQVLAYANADFSDSNQQFCDLFLADYAGQINHILDLGCGPGDIDICLLRKNPALNITAVDASEPMVALARTASQAAGYERQIKFIVGKVPGFNISQQKFDALISKDLLHHLPDPMLLWNEIVRLQKAANIKTLVFIMDLCRPDTVEQARKIVNDVAGAEQKILKDDFFRSLLAAFTADEIKEQLRRAALNLQVIKISERHLLIKGIL